MDYKEIAKRLRERTPQPRGSMTFGEYAVANAIYELAAVLESMDE